MAFALLEGIRVLDLTMVFAGPVSTKILAELGAEIIKIESAQRADTFTRANVYPENMPGEDNWNRGSNFHTLNAGKYGISLNLGDERGREIFKRLVRISDIVIENYSPRVMEHWHLGYEELIKVKPDIIMVSLSGLGHYGPLRDFYMYVPGMEGMSGLTHNTGEPDRAPLLTGHAYGDWVGGVNAAAALMAALFYRLQTGNGQYVDVSGREAVACHVGDLIMDYTLNKRDSIRTGNRSVNAAPHGCYRCKGDDSWINIVVENDVQWHTFCRIAGHPEWASDRRFSSLPQRKQNEDELDRMIEGWTVESDRLEVMDLLQKAGIASGAVLSMRDLHANPHLVDRDFFQVIDHGTGVGKRPVARQIPVKMDGSAGSTLKRAPRFGEDDDYVFGTLLKMSKAEMEEYAKAQVIGGKPSFPKGRPTRTELIQQQGSGWFDPGYLGELRSRYGDDIGRYDE
jgi:crotonobetainyl-CoA:carnitine CoA-transferase CaiB-like acyl-CoA transferase